MNTTLKINDRFANVLPALTEIELKQLEQLLIKDGCIHPIIAWNDTIVDGHNRYNLCKKNNIQFDVKDMDFDSEDDVEIWIRQFGFGRRQMTDFAKIQNAKKLEALLAVREKAKENQSIAGGDRKSNEAKSLLFGTNKSDKSINTRKEVAKAAKVSDKKVAMYDAITKFADEETIEQLQKGEVTLNEVYEDHKAELKAAKLEEKKSEIAKLTAAAIVDNNKPLVYNMDCVQFLNTYKENSVDCLMTDPPYSTDITDIESFVNSWLTLALSKVKPTGRCYICTGAYPVELQAYLNVFNKQTKFIVDNPLIWTYRNTLGITPKNKYNLNYQVIWHLYSTASGELDTSITNEMFSVQDINAPDGRQGDRFHTWQKPMELAERFVRHGTKPQATVIDPFTCTGTFLLAAAKLGRKAAGSDISKENLEIAINRGCVYGK